MTTRQLPSLPRQLALAAALAGAFTFADAASERVAAAEARTCRTNLFLTTGISDVVVNRIACRRAVRVLAAWYERGTPRRGPHGWSCRFDRHRGEAPYTRARCARNRARIRFMMGG